MNTVSKTKTTKQMNKCKLNKRKILKLIHDDKHSYFKLRNGRMEYNYYKLTFNRQFYCNLKNKTTLNNALKYIHILTIVLSLIAPHRWQTQIWRTFEQKTIDFENNFFKKNPHFGGHQTEPVHQRIKQSSTLGQMNKYHF